MREPPEKTDWPIGTLVLLAAATTVMVVAWLFLYFGVFLPRGALS